MNTEAQLSDFVGETFVDLNGFIKRAWTWGEPGTQLEHFKGPERWAQEVADDISNQVVINRFDGAHPVPVIYVGVASGNGCAKSTFAAFVDNWIRSTRPFCQGTVTANTGAQLKAKTWSQIEKWTGMCITGHWFDVKAESVTHKVHRSKWASNALTWSSKNPQAFAGQHARSSTSYYIFDEASHVIEEIFEQADGGLTDGEPMVFLFGNPGNRGGRLYRAVFGDLRGKYINRSVDSRSCEFTNKAQIATWIAERGEDSDWVRVHVKGLAPNADELQFIDNLRISEARKRPVPPSDGKDPLIMGIDFARGGSNWNRIVLRRGRDARSLRSIGIPGEKTRDTQLMISLVLEQIRDKQPDAVFGDAGGVGGPIMDGIRALVKNTPVVDVNFSGKSPDERNHNWRSDMWMNMKEWLSYGCIEDEEELETDLAAPEYFHIKDRLCLESKEDMEARQVASPDWGDALCLTFAMPVPRRQSEHDRKSGWTRGSKRGSRNGSHGGERRPRGWMRG